MTSRVQIRVNDLANLWISDEAGPLLLDRLAARYGYQRLLGEQVAVAQAEAVLEEALAHHHVHNLHRYYDPTGWHYSFTTAHSNISTPCRATHLAAAQAAVARVNELCVEPEKEKLPEPEGMDLGDVTNELLEMGAYSSDETHVDNDGPYAVLAWRTHRGLAVIQGRHETPDAFHRRALREAQAAVAHVAERRAEVEKKKLPEPEAMMQHDRKDELEKRGCYLVYDNDDENYPRLIWKMADGFGVLPAFPSGKETWEFYTCRALRRARELAQA